MKFLSPVFLLLSDSFLYLLPKCFLLSSSQQGHGIGTWVTEITRDFAFEE
ncbi:hypothetical protein BLAHAN_07068 [Blautia hansenii DSM 20583]|uniref:Uncharacterized protein n=1 Tax=Blautia hansenii DSM 20583 TaxID=537007 RepID=C9LCB0_BLAHA|nr:hypothetical protein BLAHAN_07068 [Blautia hansenii DSM 20583]